METIEKTFEIDEASMISDEGPRVKINALVDAWIKDELSDHWELENHISSFVEFQNEDDFSKRIHRVTVTIRGTRKDAVKNYIEGKICKNCLQTINVAIFKGGDWCSDDCRKMLSGEITRNGR